MAASARFNALPTQVSRPLLPAFFAIICLVSATTERGFSQTPCALGPPTDRQAVQTLLEQWTATTHLPPLDRGKWDLGIERSDVRVILRFAPGSLTFAWTMDAGCSPTAIAIDASPDYGGPLPDKNAVMDLSVGLTSLALEHSRDRNSGTVLVSAATVGLALLATGAAMMGIIVLARRRWAPGLAFGDFAAHVFVGVRLRLRALLGRLAIGLTLLVISLAVSIAFVEVAIRMRGIDDRLVFRALQFSAATTEIHRPSVDPFIHYELKPGASGHYENCRAPYNVAIDDFGARRPTHPFVKERGVFRVLAFGASTMHGACVNDNETIPAVMERMLNAAPRRAGAPRFEVWNFGTSGYILAQAARLAREKLQALDPDLIVVQLHNLSPRCFILSEDIVATGVAPAGLLEAYRREPSFANEQFANPFVAPGLHERAFAHSALYRALVAWAKLRGFLGPDCPACYELDAEEAEALSREAESRGIPVAYLVIPGDHARELWNRFLVRPSERLIDLYRPDRDPDFYEVHPRAPQLVEMAVALIEELRARRLLPD